VEWVPFTCVLFAAAAGCGQDQSADPDASDPVPEAVGEEAVDDPDAGEDDASDPEPMDGSDPEPDDVAGDDAGDGGPVPAEGPGWRVRTAVDAALYHLGSGCLTLESTIPAGTEIDAWGMNDDWVRVTWTGDHVARADIEIVSGPAPGDIPAASWAGTVGLEETGIFTLDPSGCPIQIGTALEGEEYPAYGLSHDANFHGFWQVSADLAMIAVRVLNVPEWIFPWHRAVLLIKEIPDVGFLVGGGVVVGPNAILTAAHMAVDPDFCYVLAANAAQAWYAGEGVCGTISGFVIHPEVDIGVVLLSADETRVPAVAVLDRWAAAADEFYAVNMSTMHPNHMSDAVIDEVDGRNNGTGDPLCTGSWPHGSSFTTQSSIVGGGDSGGPAFIGDGLAGIVHGESCRWPWEPYRQVFVHVPYFEDWIADVVPGA